MTISAPQIGSADMSVSSIKVSANLPARSGRGRHGGRHPSELCWVGQQKLGNKIIGLLEHTCRKLLIEDEIRHYLMTEPGHLPFGVTAGGALRHRKGVLERNFAAQMPQQLRYPDAFHCRQVGWQSAGRKPRRLIERALRDHRGEAAVAGGV